MLIIAGILLVASAVYGVILALVATGEASSVLSGLLVGPYLAFSAFGAAVGAARSTDDVLVGFGTSFLPLPWALLPFIATWVALRFAYPRLTRRWADLAAFVVKVAVVFGILAGILGSVLSFDEADSGELGSDVSAGSLAFYSILLIALAGALFLWRKGDLPVPARARNNWVGPNSRGSFLLDGARAFGLLAAGMAALALLVGLVVADDMTERVLLVLSVPFLIINLGIAGAVLAMGGSVGLGGPPGFIDNGGDSIVTHVSLFNWGFPPPFDDAGAAPAPAFALLAAALLLVGWLTFRRLDRVRPSTEQDVLAVGFLTGLGFAAVALLASLFGRIAIAGTGNKLDELSEGIRIRPSAAGALGLGLLWGIAGGLGGAFLWARQRKVAWRPTAPAQAGGPPPGQYAPGQYQTPAPGQYQTPAPGQYQTPPPGQYTTPPAGQYTAPPPGEYPGQFPTPPPGAAPPMPPSQPEAASGATDAGMIPCPRCGTQATPTAVFCVACGNQLR